MDLVVVKKGVKYGWDGAAEIADIADIGTLVEGSVLVAYENGNIINNTGALVSGVVGKKGILYYNRGEVRHATPVDCATSEVLLPTGSSAKADAVVTLACLITNNDGIKYTGVQITDAHIPIEDQSRYFNADVKVDESTVLATFYAALAVEIAKHPKVVSAVVTTSNIAVTMVAGANLSFLGIGYLEGKIKSHDGTGVTVDTALLYAETVDSDELTALMLDIQGSDGSYDTDMNGSPDLFKKTYGIEAGETYNVYAIKHRAVAGYTSNAGDKVNQVLYLAVPNGQTTSTGTTGSGEGYFDVVNALAGNPGDTASTNDPGGDVA